MIANRLNIDKNLQEFPANAGKDFPITIVFSDLGDWTAQSVPWHWHRELEFSVLLQGKLSVQTSHGSWVLGPGEGYFINRNVLHRMEGADGQRPVYLTQMVGAELLAGAGGSVFERKYLEPVMSCREIELVPFRLQSTNQRRIIEHIRSAYEAVDAETEGYEILARNELSSAWLLMMRELPASVREQPGEEDQTEARVKRMLLYIQEHYAERVTLEEIANAANISPRACLRDFQQRLHTTPVRYLIDCRLDAAARRLRSTGQSVTDIAAECGFATGSYFTKLFREKYHTTPLAYRREQDGSGTPD